MANTSCLMFVVWSVRFLLKLKLAPRKKLFGQWRDKTCAESGGIGLTGDYERGRERDMGDDYCTCAVVRQCWDCGLNGERLRGLGQSFFHRISTLRSPCLHSLCAPLSLISISLLQSVSSFFCSSPLLVFFNRVVLCISHFYFSSLVNAWKRVNQEAKCSDPKQTNTAYDHINHVQ